MAKAFINDENLTDIADAIRATLDESRQYLPSEMAAAIDSIPIMAQLNRKKYFQSVPAGAASGYATIEQIEGNTVVWNQLVDTSSTSVVVQSGHVYYANINGTASIATSDGTPISVTGGTDIIQDLTLIFGAGNEPTTVADFEAWREQNGLPAYADYNAGELLSVKMSGMQTEDSSQQTLDTLPFDVTTFTGINPNTNTREVMFSSGMKQADRAGTVKDELDILSGTATVRCGLVDLGDLSWTYANNNRFYAVFTDMQQTPRNDQTIVAPMLCAVYKTTSRSNLFNENKSISAHSNGGTMTLNVYNTAYTDAAAFTTALQGILLCFVFENPKTYTDMQDANGNPLNPRYKVEQGGTEQVLPVNTSTPTTVAPTLSTIYKKNA